MEQVEIEFLRLGIACHLPKSLLSRKAGARGLRSILEHVLLDIMYELPSIKGLCKVVIDDSVINSESAPILIYENEDLQEQPLIKDREIMS